jgi:hypothetical protein
LFTRFCFDSSRFDLPVHERVYDRYLVPGEDVAYWLCAHLRARGLEFDSPLREGDCWHIALKREGRTSRVCVQAANHGRPLAGGKARWQIDVGRPGSLADRLLRRNGIAADDALCLLLRDLLQRQYDFTNIVETRHSWRY